MTRLPHMIHQPVGYCWVITEKVINPYIFLMNPYLSF